MSSVPNWIITAEQLREQLPSVMLVDVREPEEFALSRIDGCTLIPLGELEERALRELKKDQDIVCYCAHGIRSLEAVMCLRMQGFGRVRSLEGGIAAWESLPK
jgi:sulfur-carrier protein adenylyltransferase/sulfurtransferase